MELFLTYATAVVSTILVVTSLALTVRHFKIARAVSYIERFNSPNMITVRTNVDRWLASNESDSERLKTLDDDTELKTAVITFMNLFAELGIAYRFRLVNKKVTHEIWNVLLPEYWSKLHFFIEHERSRGRAIGGAFEQLAMIVSKKK